MRAGPGGPLVSEMGTFHHVLFLVDTDELAAWLELVPFMISGSAWIPASEWPDGRRLPGARYAAYLAAMTKPGLDPMRWLFELSFRLATSRDIYQPVPKEGGKNMLEMLEPDCELQIAGATNHAGTLRTNRVSNQGGAVGLRLRYPKKVRYESEAFEQRHDAEPFDNFGLYRQLEARLRATTQPCRFHAPAGETATQLRASAHGRELLRRHAWLEANQFRLVDSSR